MAFLVATRRSGLKQTTRLGLRLADSLNEQLGGAEGVYMKHTVRHCFRRPFLFAHCIFSFRTFASSMCAWRVPHGVLGGCLFLPFWSIVKSQVAQKIAMERVVPYLEFMATRAPGTIIAFEPINEPDLQHGDASAAQVRTLTVNLGTSLLDRVSSGPANSTRIVINNGANHYQASDIIVDYLSGNYTTLVKHVITDMHHYYNWGGCVASGRISLDCVCHTGLPGFQNQDASWTAYQRAGLFDRNFSFVVGEWSVGLMFAHRCNPGGGPVVEQAKGLWQAQKWDYLSVHQAFPSSFVGDFYWTARMGYNWNPDPAICTGPTSMTDYKNFTSWDWSLIRLIKLNLTSPLSKLGWVPANLSAVESLVCNGSYRVAC